MTIVDAAGLGLPLGSTIDLLVMLALAGGAAWKGYRRRRAYWSRRSWMTFSATVLVGLALLGFNFVFSLAVDHHASWVGPARSNVRAGWIVAAVASLVGGMLVSAGSLIWFARGKASRPFAPFDLLQRGRVFISADERTPALVRAHDDEDP